MMKNTKCLAKENKEALLYQLYQGKLSPLEQSLIRTRLASNQTDNYQRDRDNQFTRSH